LPDPLALVGLGALVGLWYWMAGRLGAIRLPSPTEVVTALADNLTSSALMTAQGLGDGGLLSQLWVTVARTLGGVLIGGAAGIAIGVWMGRSERLRLVLRPPLEVLRVTPSLVAVPFLVLWFGTSPVAQVGLVVLYSLVTMQLSAFSAVRNLPPWYGQFAESLGAGRRRVMWTVIVPGILPELIGAMLVVMQLGWGLELVAELVGAQRGIGRTMSSMGSIFRTDIVIAGLLLVACTAVVVDLLGRLLAYRLTRWSDAHRVREDPR
jgi:ABC-type nitrate/sulfonate/bicarbonate transport system permease component